MIINVKYICHMEISFNTDKKKKLGLFPQYFKKIGLLIVVSTLATGISIKIFGIQFSPSTKELIKTLASSLMILGLLFIAWAKDKVEDELTILIRLKSLAWSFFTAMLYVIIRPYADLMISGEYKELSAKELVLVMLFGFLFMNFLQKRSR